MILQILLLLLGLMMVVGGANFLVEGSSSAARKFGVSEFVIGLTIVGFGTSLPELVVSVTGALAGNSDIAIGNVVGSNIFNVLFILALSSIFRPIDISRNNFYRDIPITILVTFILIVAGMSFTFFGLGAEDGLSRLEGGVFVGLFLLYVIYSFSTDKKDAEQENPEKQPMPLWQAILMIVVGLVGLIFGGRFFVNSAVEIARFAGVSDKFIAITVLAMGTSLPELATSIVAIAKKRGQMALGNILGSNVFNILLILGTSALISPMSFARINFVDIAALGLSAILIWTSVYTGKRNKIDRFDGILMLLAFAAYMVWLFIKL